MEDEQAKTIENIKKPSHPKNDLNKTEANISHNRLESDVKSVNQYTLEGVTDKYKSSMHGSHLLKKRSAFVKYEPGKVINSKNLTTPTSVKGSIIEA